MKNLRRICSFMMLLLLGSNDLARSQWWGTGMQFACCTYDPSFTDDHLVSVTACWYLYTAPQSVTGCPCQGSATGYMTVNGHSYPLLYISCSEVNAFCCVYG